jgi:hypothetical protein
MSREQRIIIDQVFNHFHATGAWPTFGQLDRPLKRDDDIDALQVLHSIPSSLVFFNRSYADPDKASPVQLRLDALALCIGSEGDLRLFFEAVRWFAELELAEPDPGVSIIQVTKQQYLAHLSSTQFGDFWINATKLVSMLIVEGGYFGIGILQGPDGDWSVTITRDIRYLAGVETLDQYHEAFNKLSNGRAVPPPLLVGDIKRSLFGESFQVFDQSQADAPTALPAERYAFIVMPFNESWSKTTLDFIRSAVDLLPASQKLEILRADEITKRGDIPLQVIESIVGAAVVIADITSSDFRRGRRRALHHIPNPNVMWELGYAMALDRNGETPFVIINQHLRKSPFDLSHSRQVEYSVPSTDRETERLAQVISENLL